MALSTEEALTFLKKSSTITGDTVFNHLSELLRHILASKPNNAVDILETSFLLKATRYISNEGDKPLREGRDPKDVESIKRFLDFFSTKEPEEKLIDEKVLEAKEKKTNESVEGTEDGSEIASTTADEEEQEEVAPTNEFEVENFMGDSIFLEAAGVGIGRVETYFVMLALKKLGDDPTLDISTIRFFGKFFGMQSNYYVFESTVKDVEIEEETQSEGGEDKGVASTLESKFFWENLKDKIPPEEKVGINLNVYWVCNKLGEICRRLPDVTPLQIRMARSLKKYLTGKLDAEVSAYPPFPGLEENYLRAQIARISANTQLAPNGFYTASGGEDESGGGNLIVNEEWAPPSQEELANLEGWVHKNLYIRKEGRCTEFELPPQEQEEENPEETETEVDDEEIEESQEGEEGEEEEGKPKEEPEEIPQPLRSIDQDKDISEGIKPWSISFSSSIPSFKNQIICLRSLLWPGAYTITTPKAFNNIYIGWGVKNNFQGPPLPPSLQKEYQIELKESVELPPQPTKEDPEEETEGDDESQAETEATEEDE